ncbi:MAG TPA: DoxX family protein [Polyangiales bacterium]|nr:DoxX family protein [Polyangiales bacterium]
MTSITADALDTRLNLAAAPRTRGSSAALWTGRVLSSLGVLFMVFDGGAKVLDLIPPEVKAANSLGWPDHALPIVGAIALLCTALYLIPRTALLGAVLLTGYFGGAIASHVRVDSPLFSHTLFPIYIAALFWVGLFLRDPRVRGLFTSRGSV